MKCPCYSVGELSKLSEPEDKSKFAQVRLAFVLAQLAQIKKIFFSFFPFRVELASKLRIITGNLLLSNSPRFFLQKLKNRNGTL